MITDIFSLSQAINDDNVLNLDAERFYREAEDYFFYFDRQDLAIKKLKAVLKLEPNNVKSLKMLGDIYYSTGKMTKAFDYYSQAAALKPDSAMLFSCLATVCEALNKNKLALDFINLAFENYTNKDFKIYAQMSDLKISLLVKTQKYGEAKRFLDKIQKVLPFDEARNVTAASHSEILKKKLALKEKMDSLHIQVVVV
ncbi:MAG: hypothetical protein K6C94_06835 [Candidatus Gastranaerophilales bacterium]|nr:hypothetical protein [Candidatus Gastranaerophilales bacterium]